MSYKEGGDEFRLSDRGEQSGQARADCSDFEAHSHSIQPKIAAILTIYISFVVDRLSPADSWRVDCDE